MLVKSVPEPTDIANCGSCFGVLVSCMESRGVAPGTAGTAENFFAGIGEKKVLDTRDLVVDIVGTNSRFVGKGDSVGILVGARVGVLVGTASNTGNSLGALLWGTAGTAANEGLFFCSIFFSISSMESFLCPSLVSLWPARKAFTFAGLIVWLNPLVGCLVG